MLTDVAVPISELANSVTYAGEELEKLNIPGGILGHVGDGNFHSLIMIDMENEEEVKKQNNLMKK